MHTYKTDEKITFAHLLALLRFSFFTQFIMLAGIFLFRLFFYLSFAPDKIENVSLWEKIQAFWLGSRLDLSILGYTFAPIVLGIILLTFFQGSIAYKTVRAFFMLYLFVIDTLIGFILGIDYGYFAFFNEHITIFIFGFFNDDTVALLKIFWKNYPVVKILVAAIAYMLMLGFIIKKIFAISVSVSKRAYGVFFKTSILFGVTVLTFLSIRGTLGRFPINHWIEDVSSNRFVNEVRKNSVYALIDAVKNYKKSLKAKRDLVKEMGFANRIEEAFRIVTQKGSIDIENPEKNLLQTTPYNAKLQKLHPNVVVIQVESFGTPILKYQSEYFDIMRSLKKHFKEDILFTNFISAANGTIVSMEPMLLNLVARPNTIPYGQSLFQHISFPTAAAKVYAKSGYETRYLYGGELSWRNVGKFFALQGFDKVEGKVKIAKTLHLDKAKYFHDWGVYDQFLYKYIVKKLKKAKKPQFIYAMTTNNHPPFELYADYKSKTLTIDDNLSKHLKGEKERILKRLYDYQYALDMVGKFLDAIKSSPLAKNTVVVITADNNTIEGLMQYDDFYQESKQIPFYIYLPPSIKPNKIDTSTPGSHKDLFPTLYRLTLSNTAYEAIGSDLLDTTKLHCGINESGIVISRGGAFISGAPKNKKQEQCDRYRKAAIAVTDFLVKHRYKDQSKQGK